MTLFPLALAAAAAGCDACGPGPAPIVGDVCGSGAIDGTDYAVSASELVIVVKKKDAFGCGALHSHVVLASQAVLTYGLDSAAAGEVTIVVPAAGLDPDDPALRQKLLPDGENGALSDGDRETIRGSVFEEVLAAEHPTLEFTLKDLSTLDGDGTATLVANIAGATSEVELVYSATKDGNDVTITGEAELDGAPHGMPRNALGFCVEPVMPIAFSITLTPGAAECDGDVPVVPPFEQTFFPDEECGEIGYNVVYNEVVGPRCLGCHGGTLPDNPALLRGGATEPLIAWEDWRVDSPRSGGLPLFEEAHAYVNLDPFNEEELPMPPSAFGEATPLQPLKEPLTIAGTTYNTELELMNAWLTTGQARNAQCADDVEKKTFGRDAGSAVPPGACGNGALRFDTVQTITVDGEDFAVSAADYFNSCTYCHSAGNPLQAPSAAAVAAHDADTGLDVVDFAAGSLPVTHPFYVDKDGAPLSFWEASVERAIDGSMAPSFEPIAIENDPFFLAFQAWVEGGYCPPE